MRKLKLNLDDLAVESFDTHAAEPEHGTVRGHVQTEYRTCPDEDPTCNGDDTCWDSCGDCGSDRCVTNVASCWNLSCVHTCAITCGVC